MGLNETAKLVKGSLLSAESRLTGFGTGAALSGLGSPVLWLSPRRWLALAAWYFMVRRCLVLAWTARAACAWARRCASVDEASPGWDRLMNCRFDDIGLLLAFWWRARGRPVLRFAGIKLWRTRLRSICQRNWLSKAHSPIGLGNYAKTCSFRIRHSGRRPVPVSEAAKAGLCPDAARPPRIAIAAAESAHESLLQAS